MYNKKCLILIIPIIIISCKFTHRCDGFDLNDYKSIAFRTNDTLKYYAENSENNDSLVLFVTEFYHKGAYEYTSSYPDADCLYDVYYQTNDIEGISIREHLFELNNMGVRIGNDSYRFRTGYYNSNNHVEIIESDYSITSSYIETNNSKCYYWIVRDLSGNRRFDSFTKMENKGIIEFHDKQNEIVWKLFQFARQDGQNSF